MSRRGFTIIELLFVITILGILAGIAAPRYNRYVIRANAAELASRVNNIETGVREAEAADGVLPAADGGEGGVPSALRRFVEDGQFRDPVGVVISYVKMSGRPFGVAGSVPAVILKSTNGRAAEALDALAQVYPRPMMRTAGMVVIPFEGTVPVVSAAVAPGGGAEMPRPGTQPPPVDQPRPSEPGPPSATQPQGPQNPVPQNPEPQNPEPQQPVRQQPVPQQPVPQNPGGGGTPPPYTPPPLNCLGLGLPPGQVKQCQAGNTNSAWFHQSGGVGHHH